MDDIFNLGTEFDDAVDALVESGRYRSREEVLREGVRLVQDRATRLASFEVEIAKGTASADRGDVVELDEAFDQVLEKLRRQASRSAA